MADIDKVGVFWPEVMLMFVEEFFKGSRPKMIFPLLAPEITESFLVTDTELTQHLGGLVKFINRL